MLSLGIVMLLAVWRSHTTRALSTSWEAIFWLVGAGVVMVGCMMYLSVLIAWWERWLIHRRAVLSFAGSISIAQQDER